MNLPAWLIRKLTSRSLNGDQANSVHFSIEYHRWTPTVFEIEFSEQLNSLSEEGLN